jgi:hypothetical protein
MPSAKPTKFEEMEWGLTGNRFPSSMTLIYVHSKSPLGFASIDQRDSLVTPCPIAAPSPSSSIIMSIVLCQIDLVGRGIRDVSV